MLPICYINEKYTAGMSHNLNTGDITVELKKGSKDEMANDYNSAMYDMGRLFTGGAGF